MTELQSLEIVQETIRNHFPEINPRGVTISFDKKKDYYMSVRRHLFSYRLSIDSEILKFSDLAFIGCLAHELCHIVLMKKHSLWDEIKERCGGTNETQEERTVDSMVIERNFGLQLLIFHEEHNKKYKSYNASEGLTKREIKKMIKGYK